ncbi:metallophosphoesterase [Stenoxybacter acetivorans]|uniref:metallophosphoesterase n=1 Tax=Stenoxybacter acetivorans TaxID=422441 RepID=UPI00055B52E9|nr:metallophosphoesterase [Stenoxybacter acetivorans]
MPSLLQNLPENQALDIVGDVHGEWTALENLLHHLGYNEQGKHPQGRKLVFVGDLCDRGPDSPAVLHWVLNAVAAERAFAILGNHEINLLINDAKDGSGWFFPDRPQDEQRYAPWQHYPAEKRAALVDALSAWPLVLQRSDLCVVHAAWLPESLAKIAAADLPLIPQYRRWEQQFHAAFHIGEWFADYQTEQTVFQVALEDPDYAMPFLPGQAHYDLAHSFANPIRTITRGAETLSAQPFYMNGRWRFTVRQPWWHDYSGGTPIIIGHYWRQWQPSIEPHHRKKLITEEPHHWLGKHHNVFCVDFSVGARWRERQKNIAPAQTQYHLAALRLPERVLILDNGHIEKTSQHSLKG